MIDARDRGFLLGDGLFETLLWTGRAFVRLERHFERLQAGCEVMGLPAPEAAHFERTAQTAVEEAGLASGRAAVRLTWSAGIGGRGLDRPERLAPLLVANAAPAPPSGAPPAVAVVEVRRNDASPASRLKSLGYTDNVLARLEARRSGADEALLLNTRGEVACAAAANVFWFEDARLVTPSLDCGVLAGIARAEVLELARGIGIETLEARADRARVQAGRGLFLTNSLIGVRAAASLDGRAVANHPGVESLAEALRTRWS